MCSVNIPEQNHIPRCFPIFIDLRTFRKSYQFIQFEHEVVSSCPAIMSSVWYKIYQIESVEVAPRVMKGAELCRHYIIRAYMYVVAITIRSTSKLPVMQGRKVHNSCKYGIDLKLRTICKVHKSSKYGIELKLRTICILRSFKKKNCFPRSKIKSWSHLQRVYTYDIGRPCTAFSS